MTACLVLERDPAEGPAGGGGPSIEIRLDVLGRPFRARLCAPPVPVGLQDIVPVARELSAALVAAATDCPALQGVRPSCREGCAACCRHFVPVSAAEALRLWEETTALPGPQRTRLLAAHLQAARRILQAGPPDLSRFGPAAGPSPNPEALAEIARWYAGLEMDCPFLVQRTCAAYEARPLACREFFAHCDPPAGPRPDQVIRLPYRVSEALAQLGQEFEPNWPLAVALPLAMAWAGDPANRTRAQSWPANVLLARLVRILRRQAANVPLAV